jgi:hypothetical protein
MVQFIADVRAGREHVGGLPEQMEGEYPEGAKLEL